MSVPQDMLSARSISVSSDLTDFQTVQRLEHRLQLAVIQKEHVNFQENT